ncbi:MAG TPA: radical SAM family heme chaperone HemW [Candidatus Binatia bacterium]|jgi:oxygen-independent coproporphyrinogen-3 oxidase|nr:radical SAM family heme chaperone HemW [Candidatus Binatia bacterium]
MSFSLYVHIPYCLVKCPYCDFNAYGVRTWPEERYVDALCAELRHYVSQPPWRGQTVETIYFGGGTPSLFAPTSIKRFLKLLASLCPLVDNLEVTLEADPATVTREKLADFCGIGINRLSFGTQSFQPPLLKTLGRLHSADDGLRAIAWARDSGFSNLSLDLIFAVPGQTLPMLESDLSQALSCAPEHISLYNLTYEENTPFFAMRQKGQLRPVDEDDEVAMYALIRERCTDRGYCHYEISSFARPGFSSRHNANYWNGGSYLGLGAGAHSFVREPGWGKRWSNEKNPKVYMNKALADGNTQSFQETLTRAQALGEFVFLRLRQLDGFVPAAFAERFAASLTEEFPHVTDLCAEGLLTEESGRIKLTPQGLLIADTVFASFF